MNIIDAPKVVVRRSLMKTYRSNRSRSHPGARARRCAELFPERGARSGRGRAGAALSVSARAAAAMGNQHSASHYVHKPSKNVRWKTAGKPTTDTLTNGASELCLGHVCSSCEPPAYISIFKKTARCDS